MTQNGCSNLRICARKLAKFKTCFLQCKIDPQLAGKLVVLEPRGRCVCKFRPARKLLKTKRKDSMFGQRLTENKFVYVAYTNATQSIVPGMCSQNVEGVEKEPWDLFNIEQTHKCIARFNVKFSIAKSFF